MWNIDFKQISLSISVNQVNSDETINPSQFSMTIQFMMTAGMQQNGTRDYPTSESEIVQMMDYQINFSKEEVSDAVD